MAVSVQVEEPRPTTTPTTLIELAGVEKVFRTGKVEYPALRGIDLTIDEGDSRHTGVGRAMRTEYERRVTGFFDRHMLEGSP